MKDFICLCVNRPVTVIMALLAVFLGACFSLSVLPLDRLPEINYPRVMVETLYPGMGAPDIRSVVTIPIEDALASVKGLERLRSLSRDGASVTVLDFRWGTDPDRISVLVREAIDAVYPSLPEGCQKPLVSSGAYQEEPQGIVSVVSRAGDGIFARNLAEYELRARFRSLDGAGAIILVGGELPEAGIHLDIPKSFARGLGPADLVKILASETADIPAGNAREGDRELVVTSSGRPPSVEALGALTLPSGQGPFRLGDVAETRRDNAPRESVFIAGGREQTALEIYRRPGADPVRLSRDIRKALKEAEAAFSRDAELTLVYDAAPSLVRGIRDLVLSALLAAAAVIGVLILFLGRLRYGLLSALAIPFSAAAALILLALTGRSLNSMSLSGLALGIGLVSDTAVIILDLLHRSFAPGRGDGKPQAAEVSLAAASVSGSSFAGALTTAVVFVPVIFLPGPLGALFGDLALALVVSVLAGWVYAQFGLPALYRLSYSRGKAKAGLSGGAGIYRPLLRRALRRPVRVLLGASLASVAGMGLLFTRPPVFVSAETASEIEVSLSFPPGTSLETVGREGAELSRLLSELPGIESLFGRAGAEGEDILRRSDPDYRREELLFRCLLKGEIAPEQTLEGVRRILAGKSNAALSASYPQDRTEALLGLSSSYTLAVRGSGPEESRERARRAEGALKAAAGEALDSVNLKPSGFRPELRFFPNRESAAFLGISAVEIAETLYTLLEGQYAGRLEIEGRPLRIRVSGELPESPRGPELLLGSLPLFSNTGNPVFLGTLGRIVRQETEAALARINRSDVVYLEALPAKSGGKKLSGAMEGISREVPGLSRADQSAFSRYRSSLFLTVILVLLLLYMTMGAQFESFRLPLIIMMTIPFSLAGAGPALFLFGLGLDSGSVLGLTVLFGLVVNNGIILYEISEEKVRLGFPAARAVYLGAYERFRPVLITTLTTLFSLLPLIISPLGASQRSMAAAMLGGILASTFLTLFALPPIFIPFLEKNHGKPRSRKTGGGPGK
ncbi:MAG: efflux RND transporter permease subunit [Treponema sp.]|jgi:multidrug efflux pump subunit AcrB|nr:efflux RND transporter permease subunit [Treponema sp.]